MVNLAINGFGRIGRVTLRAILIRYLDKVKPVAVNTSGSMDINGWAQLFEYDSTYGRFKGKIDIEQESRRAGEQEIGTLIVNHQRISVLAEREPAKIPWPKYNVDIVLEATGVFRDRQSASAHLTAGAKKVIVAVPTKGTDTFVMGVNEDKYRGDLIINNASCTTNCIAPVAKVILENFGIQKAFMTTAHAYTADQELVDGSHQDLRRARAAAINIVPTSTGAAISTAEVLPGLRGVFDGVAYRVPVVCGSLADLTFLTTRRTSVEAVNRAFTQAAAGQYRGIIETTDKPLVSSDIIGNPASAIVDLELTKVIDGDLVKVVAWYDNEWAYSCRLIEEAIWISEH